MKIKQVVGYDDGSDIAVIVDGRHVFNPFNDDGENEISFRQIIELYHEFKDNEEFKKFEDEFIKNSLEMENNKRNWIEDYKHENGMYQNTCIRCGHKFVGHKRRVICKLC